jgi:hypothetical protein
LRLETGDDDIGPFGDRLGEAKFQVARLVATEGETSQIVAFDEEAADAKLGCQARRFVQRRR